MKTFARSPIPVPRARGSTGRNGGGEDVPVVGTPKKKAASSRHLWGAAAVDNEVVVWLDENDPNYDSQEEDVDLPLDWPRSVAPIAVPRLSGIESLASSPAPPAHFFKNSPTSPHPRSGSSPNSPNSTTNAHLFKLNFPNPASPAKRFR